MKATWYVVYTQTYEGKPSLLKDPDFCRGKEVPFETYQSLFPEIKKECAFTPWMSKYKFTAQAQASLLETKTGIKHFIGAYNIDFEELLMIMDT